MKTQIDVMFNESNDTGIKATADRMANGWAAVLEFPNGGRQRFVSRYGTMEEAKRDAAKCLRVRLNYPNGVIRDPDPNQLMDMSDYLNSNE